MCFSVGQLIPRVARDRKDGDFDAGFLGAFLMLEGAALDVEPPGVGWMARV